jgi:uncharacterized membrane protein
VTLATDRLAELTHPFAERAGELGEPLGPQHEQSDGTQEEEMDGVLDAHAGNASAPGPLGGTISSERTHTLSREVNANAMPTASPPGRPYPPPGRPERVWPVQLTVLATIALQLTLPDRLTAGPFWLLPALEGMLVVGLALSSPRELEFEHPRRRGLALTMIAVVSGANIFALTTLSKNLLHHEVTGGHSLIIAGMVIWLTNFMIFSLWYWEIDRGGPGVRAAGHDHTPDFLFPQMTDDRIEPLHWRPQFVDYLYVSLTNATAFSPTDTMPLTPMAKVVMGIQSLVSLVTIGLIVSRAVNIL